MNRKLILVIFSIVFVIILIVGLVSQHNKSEQNKITVHTDAITGDTIVDAPNKTPENNDGLGNPTMLGLANIQPLFGDDLAFQVFRDTVLREEYKSHSILKVSKDNIQRAVHTKDGVTTIDITFNFFLDNKDSSKYVASVSYNQSDGHIISNFTSPDGIKTSRNGFAFGED